MNIPEFLYVTSEYDYQGSAYFIRFIVVFGFIIFPLIFLSCFCLFKISNKDKDVSFVLSSAKNLKRYEYVFHNFLFIFVIGAFSFNTAILVYSIIDIYIFEFDDVYGSIGHILKDDFKSDDRKNMFMGVIFAGGLLHGIAEIPYAYFNLYETDSFFGEKGRHGIKYLDSMGKLDSIKKRFPNIYFRFIYAKHIYKNNHKKKVVYIET